MAANSYDAPPGNHSLRVQVARRAIEAGCTLAPDDIITTVGATEDVVVPATQVSVSGATETVVAVDALNEHHAMLTDPDVLWAVRAALEGRPPPCVGLATALRSAVAPVVISRVEHTLGAGASLPGGVG